MNQGLSSLSAPQVSAKLSWTPEGGFTNAPAKSQDTGNWFTHLLPTLGSIGAGLIGGALAPETGGLSLLIPAAAQGLGSAVGKGVENAAEGQDLTNGLSGAALEGAGGGLLGGVAGKVIGGGANALSGSIQKGAQASQQAAQDIASSQAMRDAWMGVSPKLRQNLNLGQHADTISQLGMDATNPANFKTTADTALDILGNMRNQALAESGPVNLSSYNSMIDNVLANPDIANTLGAYKNARNMLTNNPSAKVYTALQNAGAGVANLEQADPNAVQQVVTRLQSLAADAKPQLNAQGVIDPTQKAVYNAYNTFANDLKGALYNRPEVDAAVAKLKGNLLPEDVGGNEALANRLNDTLTNAQNAQDLLTPMSDYINMGRLGSAGLKSGQDVASAATVRQTKTANGVSSSKIATDVPGMNNGGDSFMGIPTNMLGMAGMIGAPFTGGLSMLAAAPEAMKLIASHPGMASGALGLVSKYAPTGTMMGANVLTHSGDFAEGKNQVNHASQEASMQPMNQEENPIATLARVAAVRAAMNGDIGGIGQLQQIVAPPKATAAENASTALQGLVQAYQAAGGGQGRIGGTFANLSGSIAGGPARAYNDARSQVASQIAQATGDDPAAVIARLPDLTDEESTAQTKIQNLMSLIQNKFQTATQGGYPSSGMATPSFGLSSLGL